MHLQAGMPDVPAAARGRMDVRIARKVAALTGIAGPPDASDDAGRGRSWFADYRLLTTTELSLGGPVVADLPTEIGEVVDAGLYERVGSSFRVADGSGVGGPAPIPSVTLQEYGPDTKAALVLTGANRILRPVADAITAALDDLRTRIDDECLLVAVAQALLQEAYEAQPVLILQGIQAGLVQRALRLSDSVRSRVEHGPRPVRVARVEYGRPEPPRRHEPDQVELLRDAWAVIVGQPPDADDRASGPGRLAFRPPAGYEQDSGLALSGSPDSHDGWVALLREVSESYLVGTTSGPPPGSVWVIRTAERAHAVAVVARERQIELMLARLAPRLLPWRDVDGPRRVALPAFDPERWTSADLMVRRAVLLAQYYVVRGAGWLAGMKDLNRRRDRALCATRYGELADAADRLLVADDPLRLQLYVQGHGYVLQYNACRGRLDHATYRRIVRCLDQLVELTQYGRYPEPQLVEHLQILLVQLGTYRTATAWFTPEADAHREITADLGRFWRVAREIRDFVLEGVTSADRSYLDHDHAGFLVTDPARGPDVVRGIRILLDEVIPAREAIAGREGRSRGLRLSRQVLLHGLRNALEAGLGSVEVRCEWAAEAWRVAGWLETDRDTASLVEQRRPDRFDGFDNSVLILLLRVAEGRVAALTSGLINDQMAERIADTNRAIERVERYARGPAAVEGDPVDELRRRQVRELGERWRAWRAPEAC